MNKYYNSNNEMITIMTRSDDDSELVNGYASIFNSRSNLIAENGKVFIEIIREGAFDFALQRGDLNVLAVVNHDRKQMLARTKSGTLHLRIDSRGLSYSFELPKTSLGNDIKEQLERGDIDSSSFRYTVRPKDIKWSRDADGTLIREILRVERLMDISLVIDPAFNESNAMLSSREYDEIEQSLQRDIENKENELNAYFKEVRILFYKQ